MPSQKTSKITRIGKRRLLPVPPPRSAPLIAPGLIEKLLAMAMARGGDFAEVYLERATTTAVSLDEQKIKSAQTGLVQGIGVRVIAGVKVGYAYSDDLEDDALYRAASTAAMIAQTGGSTQSFSVSRVPSPSFYRVATPLADIAVARKADLVLRADR